MKKEVKMFKKVKLVFKWFFVFIVLSVWSFFVIASSITGSFAKDFNVPVYIQTDAGTEKASYSELVNTLFYRDFDVESKTEMVVDEKCSVRAEGSDSKLSFSTYLKNSKGGKGNFVGTDGQNRLSADFEVKDILEINENKLVLEGVDSSDTITVTYDKSANKASILSDTINVNDMAVSSVNGCGAKEEEIYLITDKGKLSERRSIEDVRNLLDENPEFVDMYENFKGLYNDYWWIALPGGISIVS